MRLSLVCGRAKCAHAAMRATEKQDGLAATRSGRSCCGLSTIAKRALCDRGLESNARPSSTRGRSGMGLAAPQFQVADIPSAQGDREWRRCSSSEAEGGEARCACRIASFSPSDESEESELRTEGLGEGGRAGG